MAARRRLGWHNALPEIMKEPRYRTRVIARDIVAAGVLLLTLERPEHFVFVPGQYVWLVLPDRSKRFGVVDRHAYSICSKTESKTLELLIRITSSSYLRKVASLRTGESVEIIGPLGSTLIAPSKGAVMVSGGTGVSPFLSILRSDTPGSFSLSAYYDPTRQLHCIDELNKLAKQRGYEVSIREGRPQKETLLPLIKAKDLRPIFISGPQNFVDRVTIILQELGVDPERMRYEALYPSNGICKKIRRQFERFVDHKKNLRNKPIHAPKMLPAIKDLFLIVAQKTTGHISITDCNGVILYVNAAAEKITGYSYAELVGQTPRIWGGLMPPSFYHRLWRRKTAGKTVICEVLNRRKNGELYIANLGITPIKIGNTIAAYIAVEADVTEFKRLDKAKTELVSLVAHQLGTPLSIINWYAEILAENKTRKSPNQKKFIAEIYHASQRMQALIAAFLEVSRIEMGTIKFQPAKTDLTALARSIISENTPLVDSKHLRVKLKMPASIIVSTDQKFITVILDNVISNAMKYTPDGGRISVAILQKREGVLITVRDTGVGIPKDQQDKIFTKLFRADNVKTIDATGSGLGLYIVKSLVDFLKGKIWFESIEGKGTTFYIALPTQQRRGKNEMVG